ncbi:hypothetical protein PRUPE_4G099300 [Prunus persica]|uniref:Serine-threonine/tyrosine-protein kinase catalytic domain-containing protein n=1 Tax=Prunus persica TaxID=3760 RepID=M5X9R4_PRUPE|nr:hypothetical protein PRUPE_4G099300 [Prunus persica]
MNYFVHLKTKKVVATYDYMSLEYATDGFYTIKSDVYSFGVLVLEIMSGKRNIGFTYCLFLFLLLNKHNVVRLIHVGHLCVQRNPGDRPSMLVIVLMTGPALNSSKLGTNPVEFFCIIDFYPSHNSSKSTSNALKSHDTLTMQLMDPNNFMNTHCNKHKITSQIFTI